MATLRESLKSLDRRTATVFLVAVVLAPTWRFFLDVAPVEAFLGERAGGGVLRDLAPAWLSFAAMFALLAVVPAILVRKVFGDRLRDYGLCLGDVRYGLIASAITAPILIVPTWLGGYTMADMAAEYPLTRAALLSGAHFLTYQALYLVFYLSWEFHFRGFILFGLEKALGVWPAIGLSIVTSGLLHLTKPTGEFYSSLLAGLIWGWIAIRTRSILWPFLVHYAVGVTNDLSLSLHFHGFSFGS